MLRTSVSLSLSSSFIRRRRPHYRLPNIIIHNDDLNLRDITHSNRYYNNVITCMEYSTQSHPSNNNNMQQRQRSFSSDTAAASVAISSTTENHNNDHVVVNAIVSSSSAASYSLIHKKMNPSSSSIGRQLNRPNNSGSSNNNNNNSQNNNNNNGQNHNRKNLNGGGMNHSNNNNNSHNHNNNNTNKNMNSNNKKNNNNRNNKFGQQQQQQQNQRILQNNNNDTMIVNNNNTGVTLNTTPSSETSSASSTLSSSSSSTSTTISNDPKQQKIHEIMNNFFSKTLPPSSNNENRRMDGSSSLFDSNNKNNNKQGQHQQEQQQQETKSRRPWESMSTPSKTSSSLFNSSNTSTWNETQSSYNTNRRTDSSYDGRHNDNYNKNTNISSSTSTSSTSSPLSEFIKSAQLKFAESMEKRKIEEQQRQQLQLSQQTNQNSNSVLNDDGTTTSSSTGDDYDIMLSNRLRDGQLPRWRITSQMYNNNNNHNGHHNNNHNGNNGNNHNNLRDMRKYQNDYNHQQDNDMYVRTTDWLREQQQEGPIRGKKSNRNNNNDNQQAKIIIPPYDVSLSEASLLFREKTVILRRILKQLGIQYNYKNDDEQIMIDIDTMELIGYELDIPIQRSTRKRINLKEDDENILLQRRSMANIDDTTTDKKMIIMNQQQKNLYGSLPPRPPVVCITGHVDHGKTTLMDSLRKRSLLLLSQNNNENSGSSTKSKSKKTSSSSNGKKGKESSVMDNVAGTEAGGITQVITAFQVKLTNDNDYDDDDTMTNRSVTFLDTPGHAAFKCMRQLGSDAADIIVLVVAADDSISEQSIEILNFYKSIIKESNGSISLVIAMNKIDKPGINIIECQRKIENQLLEHDIYTENIVSGSTFQNNQYGPPVQLIPVSGLTGQGLDDLIEGLLIQSEVMDLRADNKARGEGLIMDARIDKGLGIVVDCIVRWGIIQKGDIVVSGISFGKVRSIKDIQHNTQKENGLPSHPIRIIGFDTVPKAGEPIIVVESEEIAQDLITRRKALLENSSSGTDGVDTTMDPSSNDVVPNFGATELQSAGKHMLHQKWKTSLETKYDIKSDEPTIDSIIRIPIVIKADADGTLSAVRDALIQIGSQSKHNIIIDPIKIGVGPLLATEVAIAKDCKACIICFNVKNEQSVIKIANEEDVPLLRSDIIYRLLDDAKEQFAYYLPVQSQDVIHGRCKVQAIYDIGGEGKIAGIHVLDGILYKLETKSKLNKNTILKTQFRIIRNGKPILRTNATGSDISSSSTTEEESSSSAALSFNANTLKHYKDDVNEVPKGKDGGLSLIGYEDFQVDDIIECYSIDMVREFV